MPVGADFLTWLEHDDREVEERGVDGAGKELDVADTGALARLDDNGRPAHRAPAGAAARTPNGPPNTLSGSTAALTVAQPLELDRRPGPRQRCQGVRRRS